MDNELHKQLKMLAALKETTMQELVEGFLEQELEKDIGSVKKILEEEL